MTTEQMENELMDRWRAAGIKVPSREEMLAQYRTSPRFQRQMEIAVEIRKRSDEHFDKMIAEIITSK
jgi:hypothetical protein